MAVRIMQAGAILVFSSIVIALVSLWGTYGKVEDCFNNSCSFSSQQHIANFAMVLRNFGVLVIVLGALYGLYVRYKNK